MVIIDVIYFYRIHSVELRTEIGQWDHIDQLLQTSIWCNDFFFTAVLS